MKKNFKILIVATAIFAGALVAQLADANAASGDARLQGDRAVKQYLKTQGYDEVLNVSWVGSKYLVDVREEGEQFILSVDPDTRAVSEVSGANMAVLLLIDAL